MAGSVATVRAPAAPIWLLLAALGSAGCAGALSDGDWLRVDTPRFELLSGARQFTVVEAKMGSPLAPGTSNAPGYDQAARSVACMAEALAKGDLSSSSLERLDFVVLAPRYSIEKGTFAEEMQRSSIRRMVDKRVSAYGGELRDWYGRYFEPVIERVRLICVSWESAIKWVCARNPDVKDQLVEFYERCLEFN